MPELRVETAKVADLLPYANNARIHSDEQVEQIAQSIREVGFNDPIGCWHNQDGKLEIVEGHGRVMALKKLGIEECPVIYLDHLTDEQRRFYTHVHNKIADNGGFDFSVLEKEFESLSEFDWDSFGFDVFGGDNQQRAEGAGQSAVDIETVELRGYAKAHYLITVDIDDNDKVAPIIAKLKEEEWCEVRSTCNG